MINAPVLVLNQNYEPLNVCDIRRAFRLLGSEKAELLERNHQVIHTPSLAIAAPPAAPVRGPSRKRRGTRSTCTAYCRGGHAVEHTPGRC